MGEVRFVIPTLGNRLPWLRVALASVTAQVRHEDVVVIAPDIPEIEAVTREYSANFVVQAKGGLSHAINQGAEWRPDSAHSFVAWIGDDDALAPGAIAAASSALKAHPDSPFVFGRLRYIDRDSRSKWLLRPGSWAVPYAHWGHNFIGQPGSLIRRSAWDRVGGLDTSLWHAMDMDLFLKLAQLGKPVYIPQELAAFRVHDTNISTNRGPHDESRMIADRYRRPRSFQSLFLAAAKVSDRVLLSAHRRVPGPAAPVENGQPYFAEKVASV